MWKEGVSIVQKARGQPFWVTLVLLYTKDFQKLPHSLCGRGLDMLEIWNVQIHWCRVYEVDSAPFFCVVYKSGGRISLFKKNFQGKFYAKPFSSLQISIGLPVLTDKLV